MIEKNRILIICFSMLLLGCVSKKKYYRDIKNLAFAATECEMRYNYVAGELKDAKSRAKRSMRYK